MNNNFVKPFEGAQIPLWVPFCCLSFRHQKLFLTLLDKRVTLWYNVLAIKKGEVKMYELTKSKYDLTFWEKMDLIETLDYWNGSYENLMFYVNEDDFFEAFFSKNPADAVRKTSLGNYKWTDDFVRFDAHSNLESFTEEEAENEIDKELDGIPDLFLDLLEEGLVNDWNGAFKWKEEEDARCLAFSVSNASRKLDKDLAL